MTAENLARLLEALRGLHPKHAQRPDLGELDTTPEALAGYRLLFLDTDLGRLDVLRTVHPVGTRDDLSTVEFELVEGRRFRVLDLDSLVEVKCTVGRPKDRVVAAELQAIRDLLDS